MISTKSISKCRKTWIYVALLFVRKHIQWQWKSLTLKTLMVAKKWQIKSVINDSPPMSVGIYLERKKKKKKNNCSSRASSSFFEIGIRTVESWFQTEIQNLKERRRIFSWISRQTTFCWQANINKAIKQFTLLLANKFGLCSVENTEITNCY